MFNLFTFKPLAYADLNLLCKWFSNPHVLEWWNDCLLPEEIKEKYKKHIDNDIIFPYIVYLKDKPIGFIQYYWASKVGDGWWLDEDEGTIGLDQFIGEKDCLNKGYGTLMIKEFIHHLFSENSFQKDYS